MAAAATSILLGTSDLGDGYRVDFCNKNEKVTAIVYQLDKKIGTFIFKYPIGPLTYETLCFSDNEKIRRCITSNKAALKEPDELDVKTTRLVFKQQNPGSVGDDSDDELVDLPGGTLVLFNRAAKIPVTAMTISCDDQNIKGSTLIDIVHDKVQSWYGDVVDYACQPEKDEGGMAMIPPPTVESGVLFINSSREWFMSVGGWKGMMPTKEVKACFFDSVYSQERGQYETSGRRFNAVEIYNGLRFKLAGHRMYLPKNFVINQVDITLSKRQERGKWVSCIKTDLSYKQIVEAINTIKRAFKVDDSQVATWQLSRLKDGDVRAEDIPEKNQWEIKTFLDYLNALMFGVEASGLNAALATGLMLLDLIVDKRLDYKTAFAANSDGGFYPYACFGDNQGTYNQREAVLSDAKTDRDQFSMRKMRENPSLSPVAVKEAILIKEWLKHNKFILADASYQEQIRKIQDAVGSLIGDRFFSM